MNKIIIQIIFLASFFISHNLSGQDLLSQIEEEPETERVRNAFKATRVINNHSCEQLAAGVLDFRILHRFGKLNGGSYELYGLDQASIRFGLDYGIAPWLTVGAGRSSYKKEFDAFVKAKLLWQTTGKRVMPISITYAGGTILNSLKWQNPDRSNYFTSRLTFFHQIIIGRKFSERLTLQLNPTYVHYNLVEKTSDDHDIYAVGIGGRIKLTNRLALNVDYDYLLPGSVADQYFNPLSIGFDIETGGHVFQLHFTNALGMNERAFITETTGDWGKGDIHFGFNISRVFTIKDRKKKS